MFLQGAWSTIITLNCNTQRFQKTTVALMNIVQNYDDWKKASTSLSKIMYTVKQKIDNYQPAK